MDATTIHSASSGWRRRAVLALAPVGAGLALLPTAISRAGGAYGRSPAGFLAASQALTGVPGLDPMLAERYWAAFAGAAPEQLDGLRRLGALAGSSADAGMFMAAAKAQGLEAAASALTAAWFTGTVGRGVGARTVAYADALMYRTVADGLAPPTYVLGGPAWWTAEPPAAGVTKPVPKPAPPAPVTGTPAPQPGAIR